MLHVFLDFSYGSSPFQRRLFGRRIMSLRRRQRNHGVDESSCLDAEVDQHGFRRFARGADGRSTSARLVMRSPRMPKALASAAKSGATSECNVALVVEKFLPLTNHAEITVVDDGDLGC